VTLGRQEATAKGGAKPRLRGGDAAIERLVATPRRPGPVVMPGRQPRCRQHPALHRPRAHPEAIGDPPYCRGMRGIQGPDQGRCHRVRQAPHGAGSHSGHGRHVGRGIGDRGVRTVEGGREIPIHVHRDSTESVSAPSGTFDTALAAAVRNRIPTISVPPVSHDQLGLSGRPVPLRNQKQRTRASRGGGVERSIRSQAGSRSSSP